MKTSKLLILLSLVLVSAFFAVKIVYPQNMPAVNSIPPGCTTGPLVLILPSTQWQCAPGTLTAVSPSLGGGLLAVGSCAAVTTSITGAAVGQQVNITPNTFPGAGMWWLGYVSAPGVVTSEVCTAVLGTPAASTYNIRVIQ
jgi:hypothetical protein